jgi:hypothetical protein
MQTSQNDQEQRRRQQGAASSMNTGRKQQNPKARNDSEESLGDQIIEEVDDALGISNRLLGCSLWLLTLPFRLIGKLIGFVMDIFD